MSRLFTNAGTAAVGLGKPDQTCGIIAGSGRREISHHAGYADRYPAEQARGPAVKYTDLN